MEIRKSGSQPSSKGPAEWFTGDWHGATRTTAMTHIAIQEPLDGKAVEWMEKVTEEEYRKGDVS